MNRLEQVDPEIAKAIHDETVRQSRNLELIASENFVSEAVLEAVGSVLTNKYAGGYPGRRYYGRSEAGGDAEGLALARAKESFGAQPANGWAPPGAQAKVTGYVTPPNPREPGL